MVEVIESSRFAGSPVRRERSERFEETFNTAFTLGRRDLRPERSRSWEVGLERDLFGGRAAVSTVYFDQRFRDLVEYRYIDRQADSVTSNYANVGAALARGVELEARARLTATAQMTVSYTALHTRVTEAGDNAPERIPVSECASSPSASTSLTGIGPRM